MSHRNPSQLSPVVASAEATFSPVMEDGPTPAQTFEIEMNEMNAEEAMAEIDAEETRSNETVPISSCELSNVVHIPSATQVGSRCMHPMLDPKPC